MAQASVIASVTSQRTDVITDSRTGSRRRQVPEPKDIIDATAAPMTIAAEARQ